MGKYGKKNKKKTSKDMNSYISLHSFYPGKQVTKSHKRHRIADTEATGCKNVLEISPKGVFKQ